MCTFPSDPVAQKLEYLTGLNKGDPAGCSDPDSDRKLYWVMRRSLKGLLPGIDKKGSAKKTFPCKPPLKVRKVVSNTQYYIHNGRL